MSSVTGSYWCLLSMLQAVLDVFCLCYRQLLMSSVYVTGSYWCLLSMLQACPLNNHLAQDANKNDLDEFSESFTPAIKSVVDFAKGIPGFTLLNQDDQVTLLKVRQDKLSFVFSATREVVNLNLAYFHCFSSFALSKCWCLISRHSFWWLACKVALCEGLTVMPVGTYQRSFQICSRMIVDNYSFLLCTKHQHTQCYCKGTLLF